MAPDVLSSEALPTAIVDALFSTCDVRPLEPLLAPEFELLQDVMAPVGKGIRGLRVFAVWVSRAFDDRRIEVVSTIDAGSDVAVRFRGTARHTGPLAAVNPRGDPVTVTGVAISHVKGGLLAGTRLALSDVSLLRQIEVLHLANWIDTRPD